MGSISDVENNRSYLLRPDVLQRLRKQNALSINELAARCEVDRKTIRRWLNGGPAYTDNVAMLADILGTTPDQILATESTPREAVTGVVSAETSDGTQVSATRRRKLTVVVFKFEDFDDQAETDFFTKLAQAIGTTRPLEAIDVSPANSITITLELDPEDDDRLIKAFLTGQLSPLGITRVQDADTGEDAPGAIIDGVYYFPPASSQNVLIKPLLTVEELAKKTPKKTEKAE